MLITLVYTSIAVRPFDPGSLDDLVARAGAANEHLGITGMLFYASGNFMQALEGEAEIVDELMERIAADPRHRRIMTLLRTPIAERSFRSWSMALVNPHLLAQRHQVMLHEMLAAAARGEDGSEPTARRLVQAFSESLRPRPASAGAEA